MLDFSRFEILTFDCYGTLIDWEAGILPVLRGILSARGKKVDDQSLLKLYGDFEQRSEAGPFMPCQKYWPRWCVNSEMRWASFRRPTKLPHWRIRLADGNHGPTRFKRCIASKAASVLRSSPTRMTTSSLARALNSKLPSTRSLLRSRHMRTSRP